MFWAFCHPKLGILFCYDLQTFTDMCQARVHRPPCPARVLEIQPEQSSWPPAYPGEWHRK